MITTDSDFINDGLTVDDFNNQDAVAADMSEDLNLTHLMRTLVEATAYPEISYTEFVAVCDGDASLSEPGSRLDDVLTHIAEECSKAYASSEGNFSQVNTIRGQWY